MPGGSGAGASRLHPVEVEQRCGLQLRNGAQRLCGPFVTAAAPVTASRRFTICVTFSYNFAIFAIGYLELL